MLNYCFYEIQILRQKKRRGRGGASLKRMWIMKLTKSLLAAVALASFAMPMTATAQVGPNAVIGHMSAVDGPVYIKRAGQILRVQNESAVLAGDTIVAENGGNAMVNLNGCNGKFTPCNQFVSAGNMVSLGSNNYCGNLASLLPIGPQDAVLTAAANVPAGGGFGPAIGTAVSSKTLLALLGAGVIAGAVVAIADDDDDDDDGIDMPASP